MKIINFDHNATTPILPQALEALGAAYVDCGNSTSLHKIGRHSAMRVEKARETLCNAFNAKNYEAFFTSGGSESNNMALLSDDFEKIFISKIEHSSVYNVRPRGVEIVEIATDENGIINLQDLQEKITGAKKFLVSLMLANNESGAIQPIKKAAQIVHQNGGLIHSDIIQGVGKMAIDLEDLNIDFATISAHKFGGPYGVGALFVRRGIEVRPLIFGGGQERSKRSGTLNVPAIAGLEAAIKFLPHRIAAISKTLGLRDFIESELKKIAGENIMFFSQNTARLANTSFFAIRDFDNQTQLINFDLNGIAISNGSACSSGTLQKSRFLQAVGAKKEFMRATRISLGPENTKLEAEKFIAVFKDFYLKNLKNLI